MPNCHMGSSLWCPCKANERCLRCWKVLSASEKCINIMSIISTGRLASTMPTAAPTYVRPSSEWEWVYREVINSIWWAHAESRFFARISLFNSALPFSAFVSTEFLFLSCQFWSWRFWSLLTSCYVAIRKRCCQISQLSFFFFFFFFNGWRWSNYRGKRGNEDIQLIWLQRRWLK